MYHPRATSLILVGLGAWLNIFTPLVQAGPSDVDGLFITVQTITSEEKDRIQETAREAIKRFRTQEERRGSGEEKRTYKIVLDFNPDGQPNISSDFGACYELAHFLLELDPDVVTIAFVHGDVAEHSVLPVMATNLLVMASERKTSNGNVKVTIGDVKARNDLERQFYLHVLRQRHRSALVPAMRLLDPEVRVRRVFRLPENTPVFIDARAIPKDAGDIVDADLDGKKTKVRVDPKESIVVDPALTGTSRFDAERAAKYGLCYRILETREDVAWAFGMPPTSLHGDPLLGRNPRAWRLEVDGRIVPARVQSLKRQIKHALGKGTNLLILQFKDCGGGEFEASLNFAMWLKDELIGDDGKPVTTVAYIPDTAPDAATIVALGCNMIVMRKGATLGDFRNKEFVDPNPANNKQRIEGIQKLARQQGYADALIEGMMNPDVKLVKVEDTRGEQREWRILTEDEARKDQRWKEIEVIKSKGELLILTAEKARELNLAHEVVKADDNDLGPLYKVLGVKAADVQSSRRDWLDSVADFLCSWPVSVLLVMVGVVCLILELKLPGATLPIIIAAICFILFFWAHSQLSGQFTWLAILLFFLGLVLLGVEVFVIPGSAVTGISGVTLILLSLALVTLDHKPETTGDWINFGKSMMVFAVAILAAGAVAVGIASNLHHIPILNRLVLRPAGESDEDGEVGPALAWHRAELAELLGAIGVAATPLRPAGKVQFGEEFVDVVAESGYVMPGTRVQVVEIEGNRVVVKEV